MLSIREARSNDFEAIATFIDPINEIAEKQSLHCSVGFDEILSELKDFNSRKELLFLLMFEDTELIGVFGGDTDYPLTEIWLWGPFIRNDKDWKVHAILLYNHLIANYPTIKQSTAFNNIENTQARTFYKEQQFSEKKEFTHEYQCLRESASNYVSSGNTGKSVMVLVEPDETGNGHWNKYKKAFHLLHNSAFPNPYYTTEEIQEYIKKVNIHKLWLLICEEKLVGYLFGSVTPSNTGYVHFLAVKKEERKKGYASQLLSTSLQYFFEERVLEECCLTVSDENNARRLYEKTGFKLRYTGVGARKKA